MSKGLINGNTWVNEWMDGWVDELQEGRKEMFYLMMYSTHFNLGLYGVRHMVKDHSDSERGNLLPPQTTLRLLLILVTPSPLFLFLSRTGMNCNSLL